VRARDKALREAFYSCCRLFGGANRVCRLAVGVTAARERCADSVGWNGPWKDGARLLSL